MGFKKVKDAFERRFTKPMSMTLSLSAASSNKWQRGGEKK
jgi:hypothetical protein